MSRNPSDRSGPIQTGQKGKGIILNRQDPLKQNRYLVAIQGMDGELGQPQWMVVQGQGMGTRMLGGTTRYMVGDWVSLEQAGNSGQIFEITGSHKNEKTDENTKDKHLDETSDEPYKVADSMGPVQPRVFAGWGTPGFTFGDVNAAKAYVNGQVMTQYTPYKDDPVKAAAEEGKTPDKYVGTKGANIGKSHAPKKGLGVKPYPLASPNETDKDLEAAGVDETVKKARSMVDNLRKTIEGGLNPKMPDSVGGMGNIMSALSSIASLFSSASNTQQNKQQQRTVMESTLRAIYKNETGKDALDIFGKETQEYKTWRTAYLALHDLTDVYDTTA